MKREFSDDQLKAQIITYLWDQGAWGQIYTNYPRMKNRLSKVVNNNGNGKKESNYDKLMTDRARV